MDTQQPNLQPTMPPASQTTPAPSPVVIPKPPPQIPTWAIAIVVVVMGFLAVFGVGKVIQKPAIVTVPTPTPTISPVPTPIRTLSPFATTSAFMQLDASVTSFSTAIKAYNTSDPSLSPPVLDLNLGL